MSPRQRMARWDSLIARASKHFGVPAAWIRSVMQLESGGRTMLTANQPITSSMGAMGLMQLMPATYQEMGAQCGLGRDPFDPHDNVFAGTAYLHWLFKKYGYPELFAAYNDGPGNLEARLFSAKLLPAETQTYVSRITGEVAPAAAPSMVHIPDLAKFTRADGTPIWVDIGASPDVSVREANPEEVATGVRSVVTVGAQSQGVWENKVMAQYLIDSHRLMARQ